MTPNQPFSDDPIHLTAGLGSYIAFHRNPTLCNFALDKRWSQIMSLTHWSLQFTNTFAVMISSGFPVKLPYATWPHCLWINIGTASDNGLVPSGDKPCIIWTNVHKGPWRNLASLCPKALNIIIFHVYRIRLDEISANCVGKDATVSVGTDSPAATWVIWISVIWYCCYLTYYYSIGIIL